MWRKTRQPNSCWYNAQPGKPKGIGTDANRNFGYKWGTGGSSNNPCMPDYRGEAPFSAPETANMRAWLTLHRGNIKFYNSVHSHGQMILLPWGFTAHQSPHNIAQLRRVAMVGQRAIYRESGMSYKVRCNYAYNFCCCLPI